MEIEGGTAGVGGGSPSTATTETALATRAIPLFRGNFTARLEASGRLLLPAAFKEAFPTSGTVRPYRDRYLNLWNPVGFEAVLRAYEQSGSADVFGPHAARRFAMSSFEVSMDRQHRFVIPPDLRARAGLEGEVVLAGSRETIEIWPASRFAERVRPDLDEADLFLDSFGGL